MEWIERKEVGDEPNPELGKILVWGKCGYPHVAYYVYGSWNHTDACSYDHKNKDYDGSHHTGSNIEFDFWIPVPNQPERSKREDTNEKISHYLDILDALNNMERGKASDQVTEMLKFLFNLEKNR